MKRKLTFWRVFGIVALTSAIVVLATRFDGLTGGSYVAMLDVNGIILDDLERDEVLDHLARDDDAKALIVRIDSPGGTFVGGEALYLALRQVGDQKPVIAVIGNLGTSAAYMAAIASDYILVRGGSITASIGVLMQSANVTGMLEKIGIQPVIIKSDPLKAQPNPMESFSDEGRAMISGLISDMHDSFVDMVAERRSMSDIQARSLADGRILSGRQAIQVGLVDAIGGKREALAWLSVSAGIQEDLRIVNITPVDDIEAWSGVLSKIMGKTLFSERLSLDGVLSLWHPQIN
jgi:protease-4